MATRRSSLTTRPTVTSVCGERNIRRADHQRTPRLLRSLRDEKLHAGLGQMTDPVFTSGTYARWRATPLGEITERVETALILGLAGPLKGKRLLDVGTGDGHYAIAAAMRGVDVTALDSALPMLEATRQRAKENGLALGLVQSDAEA